MWAMDVKIGMNRVGKTKTKVNGTKMKFTASKNKQSCWRKLVREPWRKPGYSEKSSNPD